MNANPCACAHINLTYDNTLRIVRCLDCDSWQDIDDAWYNICTPDLTLNPDNEPTSDHMQWRKENDDA